MKGILDGVKVLGLEQQVAGPTCTMMLADQGAEVLKVERPGTGDTAREMAPLLKSEDGGVQSGYFARFNRGKKSITIDMQSADGQAVLWDLIKEADIVIENLKPGLMDKLGFTYEKIKEVNPGLIYVAISGFGRSKKYEGPYAKRLAYDIIAQAMAGLMYTCGSDPQGPPTWLGFALGDSGPGVYAAYAAMLAREIMLSDVGQEFLALGHAKPIRTDVEFSEEAQAAILDNSMYENVYQVKDWAVFDATVAALPELWAENVAIYMN